MIVKTKDVIGLKVITLNAAEKVEDVNDVMYDPQSHRILGLVVKNKGLLSDAQVILMSDIKSIGPDAVVIETAEILKKTSDVQSRTADIATSDTYLTKTNVMTEDGKDLGKISDLIFDTVTGIVDSFEISPGGLKHLQSGMKYASPNDIVTVGKDAIIVSRFTEAQLDQQTEGGIKGMVNQTKEQAQDLMSQAQQKTQELTDQAKEAWNVPQTQEQLANVKAGATSAYAETKEQVQETTSQVKERINEATDDPKNQQQVDNLKQGMSDAAGQAKDKIEEVKQSAEMNQHKNVVGQYLTQNIIDSSGHLLAPRGSMVTQEFVQQAIAKDRFDIVLENVSKEPIST